MMLINGKNHTRFAGAWSVLNMHEIAVVSGFSAACKLGPLLELLVFLQD